VAAAGEAAPPAKAVLVKLGSVTHSFDFGQRLAALTIESAEPSGSLTLKAPANANLYPPGYYMLFCLDQREIPSRARIVQLLKA
jgi:hypothetical protein